MSVARFRRSAMQSSESENVELDLEQLDQPGPSNVENYKENRKPPLSVTRFRRSAGQSSDSESVIDSISDSGSECVDLKSELKQSETRPNAAWFRRSSEHSHASQSVELELKQLDQPGPSNFDPSSRNHEPRLSVARFRCSAGPSNENRIGRLEQPEQSKRLKRSRKKPQEHVS